MAVAPDSPPVLDAQSLVAGYQRDINILSGRLGPGLGRADRLRPWPERDRQVDPA